MAVSENEFRRALSCFASGVNVVTTVDSAGGLHGLTVSAFCSVSLTPPLVLICIEKKTASHFAFGESRVFAVNILKDSQSNISEHFATPLSDKFTGIDYVLGIDGIPVLEDTMASLECRIKDNFDGGDHSIFVGEVERSKVAVGSPLIYFQGDYRTI